MDKDYPRKPRKIMRVKRSKYGAESAVSQNREYWKSVLDEITNTHTTPDHFTESSLIAEVLPYDLYDRVCDMLNIPKIEYVDEKPKPPKEKPRRMITKEPMISFRTTININREADSDTDVELSDVEEAPKTPKVKRAQARNCHYELLKKPVREMITWNTRYLPPETEEEKSLVTKSDDVTDRIAREFCQYMSELGGNQQSQLFTPPAIKELFQIEFNTHVARGLQVVPKEIPAVLDKIAHIAGSPEKSQLAVLEREVAKDIEVEARPDATRAFGTSLPDKQQWLGPKNDTKAMWRSARHVPKDLVTLKTVWEGITNLRSVREYCHWMIDNPEYRRAPYLRSVGMFDPAVLEARATFELKGKEFPLPRTPSSRKPAAK